MRTAVLVFSLVSTSAFAAIYEQSLNVSDEEDLISLEQRDDLLRRSPHNVVHLTLGEDRTGDTQLLNKYTRAAGLWQASLRLRPRLSF